MKWRFILLCVLSTSCFSIIKSETVSSFDQKNTLNSEFFDFETGLEKDSDFFDYELNSSDDNTINTSRLSKVQQWFVDQYYYCLIYTMIFYININSARITFWEKVKSSFLKLYYKVKQSLGIKHG